MFFYYNMPRGVLPVIAPNNINRDDIKEEYNIPLLNVVQHAY